MRTKTTARLVVQSISNLSRTTKPVASPNAWDEFDWDRVLLELKRLVQSDSSARNALRKLIRRGCDERAILRDLYLFCGGEPAKLKRVKRALAYQKKNIGKIAETLREAAAGIEYAEKHISEAGVECHFTPDTKNLLAYANLLYRLHERVLPPKKRLSGRDQHLAYLARTIEAVTGRAHYRDLADLVSAIEIAYDPKLKKLRGAGALRKLVDRTLLDSDSIFELQELRDSMHKKLYKTR